MQIVVWTLLITGALSPLRADEHSADGRIARAGSTMSFRASVAVWIPGLNRVRLFLLAQRPSSAELDSLKEASQKPWGIHEVLKGKLFTEVEFEFKEPVEKPGTFTSGNIGWYTVSVYTGKGRPHSTTTSLLAPPKEFKLFKLDLKQELFQIQAEGSRWSFRASSDLWVRDSRAIK